MGVFRFFVLYGGMRTMRFAGRVLVAGILMVCCRGAIAAESSTSWWPFGHHADAGIAQPPVAGQPALPSATNAAPSATMPPTGVGPVAYEAQMPTTSSNDHWMVNTPKKKVR